LFVSPVEVFIVSGLDVAIPVENGIRSSKNLPIRPQNLRRDGEDRDVPRLRTSISELDRVTGGGLVPGSAILVGGDPGIGKSTLLLQTTGKLAASGLKTAYISGEESVGQVRRRAKRLGVSEDPVSLAAETSLSTIIDGLAELKPDVVIIDSIQTLWSDQLSAAPGTVAQVRACAQDCGSTCCGTYGRRGSLFRR